VSPRELAVIAQRKLESTKKNAAIKIGRDLTLSTNYLTKVNNTSNIKNESSFGSSISHCRIGEPH